ncbi:MAG: hypothetical protein ACLFT4_08055, partial [Bacteroidales bacterium]
GSDRMSFDHPPAWYKYNEVSKEKEIEKEKKINKKSDPYNFLGMFLGEYEIAPKVEVEDDLQQRKITVNNNEREVDFDTEERKIQLDYSD